MNTADETPADEPTRPLLRVVRGDATPEEVAALVAVVSGIAAASGGSAPARPRSEWAAPHRKVRAALLSGPAGWRSSALPR
ncbi:MAG: acyl-CoA carboxylase subunit epsilon [Nocardioidaceae bacterium]